MSGSLVGGVVGAVIGYVGSGFNPMGAYYGFVIGSMAGGMLFPPDGPTIRGPRLEELRVQDSSYGRFIPQIFGTYRLSGNIIWMGEIIEKKKTKRSGGKGGGGGAKTVTYTYFANFAVALCAPKRPEGILGIRRIWANNKLIFDLSTGADAKMLQASLAMINGTTMELYLGTEDQLPSPTIEAEEGVGNVPAHRGLAYVVFKNFPLADYGNYLPQLSFEVVERGELALRQSIVGQWTYGTAISTMFGASNVNAASGYVAGLGYYYGYTGVQVRKMTAQGLKWAGGFGMPGDGLDMLFPAVGHSLTDNGILGRYSVGLGDVKQAWVSLPKGGIRVTNIPSMWIANSLTNYVKEGDVIWASSGIVPIEAPIFRDDGPTCINSTDVGPFGIIGVSANYLYAIKLWGAGSGELRRYNKTTLEFVEVVMTGCPGGITGYVVSDTLMYVAVGGPGVYKIDLNAGTITNIINQSDTGTLFPSPVTFRAVTETIWTYVYLHSDDTVFVITAWEAFGDSFVPLADIISEICEQVGLSASQYDVSGITDTVRGFAVSNLASAKDALYALLQAYFVDAVESGGKIKFVKRGKATAGSMDSAYYLTDDSDSGSPLPRTVMLDSEIPAEATLSYASVDFDQQLGTQRAARQTSKSQQNISVQVPAVFRDGEARKIIEVMLSATVVGSISFAWKTPRNYLYFEPTDDVVIDDPDTGETFLVRILSKNYTADGMIEWTGIREDTSIYPDGTEPPVVGASSLSPPATIPYVGPSQVFVLDGPPLRDDDTTPAVYLAAAGYADNWPGCVIELSRDYGQTWSDVTAILDPSVMGYAASKLNSFPGGNMVDEINRVTVELIHGELTSTTYSGLLAGTNAAYLGDEIIFFRDAVQLTPTSYQLSGLLRGRQGTQWAMTGHAVNDRFVLLSADTLYRMPLVQSDLTSELEFFSTTINDSTEGSTELALETIDDACVKPLAPGHFHAGHGSASSSSDITLQWVRQARVDVAWVSGSDVPLDQSSESYLLKIKNGTTVVRSVTVTGTRAYVYSSVDIATDGFAGGATISFEVAQNSDRGILGHATTTSITR